MNGLEGVFVLSRIIILFHLKPNVMLRNVITDFDVGATKFFQRLIWPDTECLEHIVPNLIIVDLIFYVRVSGDPIPTVAVKLRKVWDVYCPVGLFQFGNVEQRLELGSMDVKRRIWILVLVDWLVQNDYLIKFSVASHVDVLLPIEDLVFDEVVIEWEVVEMSVLNWDANDILDFLVNEVHLLLLRSKPEKIFHLDGGCVHGPFHNLLNIFDCWIHEVTRKAEHNLRVKVLFSNFLY